MILRRSSPAPESRLTFTIAGPRNILRTISRTMQAAQALLKIYKMTGEAQYLDAGRTSGRLPVTHAAGLESSPVLTQAGRRHDHAKYRCRMERCAAMLSGGSAARLLSGGRRFDYLERAVAAARSGFAVAPWENWAHNGMQRRHGSLTGFHWGTGSQMASVEMMAATLGDAIR